MDTKEEGAVSIVFLVCFLASPQFTSKDSAEVARFLGEKNCKKLRKKCEF